MTYSGVFLRLLFVKEFYALIHYCFLTVADIQTGFAGLVDADALHVVPYGRLRGMVHEVG